MAAAALLRVGGQKPPKVDVDEPANPES